MNESEIILSKDLLTLDENFIKGFQFGIKSVMDDLDISIPGVTITKDTFTTKYNKKFVFNINITDTLPADTENVSKQDSIEKPKYQFIKLKHGAYKIVYNGEPILLKKLDYDGLSYIQSIIRHGEDPDGIGINASKLKTVITPNPEQTFEGNDAIYKEEVCQDNTSYQILDKKALKILQKKWGDNIKELNEGVADVDKMEKLQEEIGKIRNVLNQATDKNGRLRKPESDLKKDYRVVSKSIEKVKERIKQTYQNFYQYLDSAIQYQKGEYSYIFIPSPKINWILDE